MLSERWAAVWTWAEERKKKLAKTHLHWNKFREEEKDVLWWLTEKEQSLGAVSEIDITDDQQVKTRLNLMKVKKINRKISGFSVGTQVHPIACIVKAYTELANTAVLLWSLTWYSYFLSAL